MKSILGIIIYPAAALIVFVLALCVILALKGKLNAQTFSGLPVVGTTPAAVEEKPSPPVQTVSTLRYFSSEELSDMLKETRQRLARLKEESAAVAAREKQLVMTKEELQREKKELEQMRADLDAQRLEMKRAEIAYSESVAEIKQAELAGLERSALIYAAMDSKKAAAAMCLLDKTQAAKLLAFMDEKKAARVLGEMQPQAAAELMSMLKQVKAESKND